MLSLVQGLRLWGTDFADASSLRGTHFGETRKPQKLLKEPVVGVVGPPWRDLQNVEGWGVGLIYTGRYNSCIVGQGPHNVGSI